MREFDLEKAKAGHPVQTRDGHKARIICFDRKDSCFQIIALIDYSEEEGVNVGADKGEVAFTYTLTGRNLFDRECESDLVMAPEKHEGWVNFYRDADTGLPYCGKFIYPSESDAVTHNDPADASGI